MTINSPRNKWPIYLAAAASLLIIVGIVSESRENLPDSAKKLWPFPSAGSMAMEPEHGVMSMPTNVALLPPTEHQHALTFHEIAIKYGTDKVTVHSYQDMYEKYLPPLRNKKLKFLEIGLGCDMAYGPGASYHLWLEYFPNVELYFLEYDAACAAQWAHKTSSATVITGDQADPVVLEKLVAEHGPFDIIVDDGGHTMVQQQTSLEHLWKAIVPGGIYFCEDLQTSYWDRFGGGAVAAAAGTTTMMQYIFHMMEDLTWGPRRISFPEVDSIVHIDCSREVCAFFKRFASNLEPVSA